MCVLKRRESFCCHFRATIDWVGEKVGHYSFIFAFYTFHKNRMMWYIDHWKLHVSLTPTKFSKWTKNMSYFLSHTFKYIVNVVVKNSFIKECQTVCLNKIAKKNWVRIEPCKPGREKSSTTNTIIRSSCKKAEKIGIPPLLIYSYHYQVIAMLLRLLWLF